MESARAGTPRASRRPTLTAVIVSDRTSPSTVSRLGTLTAGIADHDDVEVVLVLTGTQDEDAMTARAAAVAAGILDACQVVPAPDADVATVMRCGAAAARGAFITFLQIGDEVSTGYLAALVTSIVPETIGVAATPGWTPAWSRNQAIARGLVETTSLTGKVFPVATCRDVPVPTGLDIASAGAVLLAGIAGAYRYQHLTLSAWPARAGAVHRSSDTDDSGALSGLIGLHRADGTVDAKTAAALVRVWMEQLRDDVRSGRADATALYRTLTGHGVDVLLEDLLGDPPSPVLSDFFSDDRPRGEHMIAVVLSDVAGATHVISALRALSTCGSIVAVIHSSGEASSSLSSHVTVIDTRVDPEGAATSLSEADDIVAIDGSASATAQQLVPERTIQRGVEALLGHYLDRAARSATGGNSGGTINLAARRLAAHKHPLRVDPWTWPVLALRALRVRSNPLPDDLIATGRQVMDDNSHARAALDAVAALVDAESLGADGLRAAADGVIARADAVTEERTARFLHYLGMELLFEPSQHTSVPTTPLVESPERYLTGLHRSRLHRLITSPGAPTPPARGRGRTGRAVLLCGAFPKFFGVLQEALSVDHTVDCVDLSSLGSRFRNVMMDPTTFRLLLDAAEGRNPHLLDRFVTDQMAADVVVADWADKGLALASRTVPDGTRLFARVHGSDTLSPWAHLTRWDRVDGVIAPSDHLARALRAAVGPAMDNVPVHVVPNPVDTSRFATDKSAAARRTLGLIGWAQRVKDATFALDLLALLRGEDPSWRLRMVGADFSRGARRVEKDAAHAYRARSAGPDVAGGIEYIPFTTDVSSVMSDIGWSLSTSLRESFHLGLFEMAASGAVPVVRDWPVYASTGGASSFVPPAWVVPTPEAGAARILDVDAHWETERLAARDHVVSRYDHDLVVEQLRDVLSTRLPHGLSRS